MNMNLDNADVRRHKLELMIYFSGRGCVCGSSKLRHHWECKVCWEKMFYSLERGDLEDACLNHVDAIQVYLDRMIL